jgi:ABC-type dipeptide/oligopeptide/nickel transport system ATPase component
VEPLLEIQDLRASFATGRGLVQALDGVQLGIRAGEVVGLVGESGSGKSVTAAAILRLLKPPGRIVGGRILLNGVDLLSLDEPAMREVRGRQVAMIFQSPRACLDPVVRVGRQLLTVLEERRGVSGDEARRAARDLLTQVRLPEPASQMASYPHELSGGMCQRVMIATALACRPRLLLADEPTTGLDVTIQHEIISLLRDLADTTGMSQLLISHDMGVVAEACDAVAVMYAGQVVERTFKYAGAGDYIFMVGAGPGNCVYGSTAMPLEVFRYDPDSGRNEHLGGMPGGEVYSTIEHEQKLYLCYYGGAVMNLYDPAKPFWKFGTGADCNPISFGGVGDGHLRPRSMIRGADGLIYVGSEPPYGELGGALGVWDPRQNRTVENYRHLITNQSITSLAWEPKSGLIFGGSGNYGGGGTRATETEAKFFAFDPKRKQKVFETALVPGAAKYPATFAAEGKVFTTVSDKLLMFDPRTMKVVRTITLPAGQLDISLDQHRGGKLVGLTSKGVYIFDLVKDELVHKAEAPVPVKCGFALVGDAVYFGSKAELWRYSLPASVVAKIHDKRE